MKATANRQENGSGREILGKAPESFKAPARRQGQRGFTLVELLAVMAIIGILAGVVAGAVSGLGATGVTAQIVSDTKTIETSADRFFNDAFPQVYPALALEIDPSTRVVIDPLVVDAGDLGVRLIDFDARLPQDPTKTFTPNFIKDIPNSAALVSYRVDTNTGNVFAAADGAQLIRPSTNRLNVSAGDKTLGVVGSTTAIAASDYSFVLKMKKNESAPEIVTLEIPAGYALGGSSVALDTDMGTLKIVYSTDNPWDPGQVITINTPIVATGEADRWTITVDYDANESTGASDDVDVKNETLNDPKDVRVHTLALVAPTEDTPGKITLTMDRETDPDDALSFVGHGDPAHNEATETWTLVIYDHPQVGGVDVDPVVNIFTNPSVNKVYRWLARESTTIDVAGVFEQVAGKQAIIIKGGTTGVRLTSIDVTPVNPSVEVGATQLFIATGTFSDGNFETPLSGVTWNALTPSTATIDSSGLATVLNTASPGDVAIFTVTRNGTGDGFALTVTADVTDPFVTGSDPVDDPDGTGSNVALTADLTVTFSEPVSNVNSATFTVNDNGGAVAGTVTLATDGLSATFAPTGGWSQNTTFTWNVTSAVTDTSGRALDLTNGNASGTFHTGN